jgi:hypothetical protein
MICRVSIEAVRDPSTSFALLTLLRVTVSTKRARQERDHLYDQLPTQNISVVFCKYLYTGKLSFSVCLAENPGPILAAAEGCVNRVDEAEVAGFE